MKTVSPKNNLNDIFSYLKSNQNYKDAIKARSIKIILGSSVIRVFAGGSKKQLIKYLAKINTDILLNLRCQSDYDEWHHSILNKLFACLKKNQANVDSLTTAGLKWGHSTKILNLFIGHLVMMSPFFNKTKKIERLKFFLHVPLDSKVFAVLKTCNVSNIPKNIKSISKDSYYKIQSLLRMNAEVHQIPAIYFDEYAWALEK